VATPLDRLIRADFAKRQAQAILDVLPTGGGGGTGGGGAFGGVTNAIPTTYTVSNTAAGAGRKMLMNGWAFSKRASAQPGPDLVADNPNFSVGPAVAGWYQIRVNLYLGFSVGAQPLPDHVRFEMSTYYDNFGITQDVPVTPPEVAGGFSDRAYSGCQACIVTHVFYTVDLPSDSNAGWQPAVYWNGDAGVQSNGHTVTLDVAKLG
jgi:hypothetical protein